MIIGLSSGLPRALQVAEVDDQLVEVGDPHRVKARIGLVEQGHDVHVAYMTSGNIAVFDHDAQRQDLHGQDVH